MAVFDEDQDEATTDQIAVRWFLRMRSGELTDAERQEFELWLSNSMNAAPLRRTEYLWHAIDEIAAKPEIIRLRADLLADLERRRLYRYAAIAASIVIVVVSGLALIYRMTAPTFATTVGERSIVTLRDGSVVTLNTDSEVRVAYSNSERAIVLSRGEALFEVAKGERRPFVVYAADRRVAATGTAFDIRLADSTLEVTLIEGKVKVGQATGGAPNQAQVDLQAGQRLTVRDGAMPLVGFVNVEHVTSWTAGKLVFLDTRLADAVAEANRYTPVSISLSDSSLDDLRVNGVFRAGQPGEFVRAIAQIYPVAAEYYEDGHIRLVPKAD